MLPTCSDLSIGDRAWRGSKPTYKILKIRILRTVLVGGSDTNWASGIFEFSGEILFLLATDRLDYKVLTSESPPVPGLGPMLI